VRESRNSFVGLYEKPLDFSGVKSRLLFSKPAAPLPESVIRWVFFCTGIALGIGGERT